MHYKENSVWDQIHDQIHWLTDLLYSSLQLHMYSGLMVSIIKVVIVVFISVDNGNIFVNNVTGG